MTPIQHEKNEWSRMAQAAFHAGLNDIGNRFSELASISEGESMPLAEFYAVQDQYRAWLIGGFEAQESAR